MLTQQLANDIFYYKDGKLFWKISISARSKQNKEAGYTNPIGYRIVRVYGKNYKVHRVIYLMHHGYLPEFLDHIDCDKLNNLLENLRPATKAQNQWNHKIRLENTSGAKCVCWDKSRQKWMARINANGKNNFVGRFVNFDDAVNAVNQSRKKLHGDFANNGA